MPFIHVVPFQINPERLLFPLHQAFPSQPITGEKQNYFPVFRSTFESKNSQRGKQLNSFPLPSVSPSQLQADSGFQTHPHSKTSMNNTLARYLLLGYAHVMAIVYVKIAICHPHLRCRLNAHARTPSLNWVMTQEDRARTL